MNAGFSNLDTLKKHLLPASLGAKETRFDLVISALGLGMFGKIENHCQRKFMRMTGEMEILPADRANFLLSRFPLEQLSLVEIKVTETPGWVAQDNAIYNTVDLRNGMVLFPAGQDAGPYFAQVRFTYDGGLWWEQLEPDDAAYPSQMPATATALPDDLKLAWLLQCQTIWAGRDKLGLSVMDKPHEQSQLSELRLIPLVKEMLQPFVRYNMT